MVGAVLRAALPVILGRNFGFACFDFGALGEDGAARAALPRGMAASFRRGVRTSGLSAAGLPFESCASSLSMACATSETGAMPSTARSTL